MRVVDHAQQGVLVGRVGQDGEGGHPHEERLDRGPATLLVPERDTEGPGLRRRQPVPAQHRAQEPVQRRERQRCLGGHPCGAQHPDGRLLLVGLDTRDQVAQQGGLAHARVAQHGEHRGPAGSRRGDQRGEVRTLLIASMEHVANLPPGRANPAK